jgi:cytochrome c oxidase subunit II
MAVERNTGSGSNSGPSNDSKNVPKKGQGRVLAVVVWLMPLIVVWAGARTWMPPLASEHGAGIDRMLHFLLYDAAGLLVAGHLALGYFLWRFGGQPRISFRQATARQEKRWIMLPIVLMSVIAEGGVLVIGLPVWAKLYDTPPPPNAVVVEVTPEQFAWNIHYAGKDGKFGRTSPNLITLDNAIGMDAKDPAGKDDILLVGELHLPVNRAARIRLRSKDVIHSFFLPMQRIKQDVVPGMTNDVLFVPTVAGDFEIACAELCGFGHYQMRGLLRVESEEKFEAWLAEMPTYGQ